MANAKCTKALLVLGALVLGLLTVVLLTASIRTWMLWQNTDFPMIVPLLFLILGVISFSCSITCCRKSCCKKDKPVQEFTTTPITASATTRPSSTIISISLPTHLVPGAPAGYHVVPSQPAVDIVQPSSPTYTHSHGLQVPRGPRKSYNPGVPVAGPFPPTPGPVAGPFPPTPGPVAGPFPSPPGHMPRRYSPLQHPYPATSRPSSIPTTVAPYFPHPLPGSPDYNPPYNPSVDPPPYTTIERPTHSK